MIDPLFNVPREFTRMNHRILASLASLLLVGSAYANPPTPSYAVISLVGDKLDIVTYQPQVGNQLDNNSHMPLTLSQDDLDATALRAINRSLRASAPGAPVALLAASTADSFAEQSHMFNGDHVVLPAEIDAAVHREGVTMLVLVTKHRGEARLRLQDGYIGSGKIEGLGFYMNSIQRMKTYETGVRSLGYLAPFVYVDVALVDVASATVIRRTAIATGQVIGASNSAEGVNPWDALSAAEKVSMLERMLSKELEAVVPALLNGSTMQSANASTSSDPGK
jgi:hypothetical protein